jgi:hypothetical protein
MLLAARKMAIVMMKMMMMASLVWSQVTLMAGKLCKLPVRVKLTGFVHIV